MSIITTRPDELGELAAEAIRETLTRATGSLTVAAYAEAGSPISWAALGSAGWDRVGAGDEAASLRDLVEIGIAWGAHLVPLPLVPTIVIRRHVPAAEDIDGPISFSIPVASNATGWGVVPYGETPELTVLVDAATAEFSAVPEGTTADFDPALRARVVPLVSSVPPALAADLQAVWTGEAAGIARRVVSDAVGYVKQRQQFGAPIGSFQAVKHHLANAHLAVEQVETAAIWASLEPDKAALISAHGLRYATEAVELAIQVHGGLGFTWELGLHFFLRHLQQLRELGEGLSRG